MADWKTESYGIPRTNAMHWFVVLAQRNSDEENKDVFKSRESRSAMYAAVRPVWQTANEREQS